jgi:cell division protein FtsB
MNPRIRRAIWTALALGVAWFAVEGGEYGTSDLARQRLRKQRLTAEIDTIRRDVDSLTAMRKAILTDPAVQERIAREEFGMVKGSKEMIYRFANDTADTARKP